MASRDSIPHESDEKRLERKVERANKGKTRTDFLNDSTSVHLERELENMTLERIRHRRLLHLGSLLE